MKMRESLFVLFVVILLAGCGGSPSDSGDNGDDSDPPEEDTTAPASPSGVEGDSGDQKVELSWDANNESDLDGYNLYRSESSFSDVSNMNPVNGSTLISDLGYTDTGLENGTTYYYRLTAVDENDNESGTSPELEITPFADPPDRP